MKRNFLFLICFCVFVANVLEIRATNPKSISLEESQNELPPSYEEIVLQGSLALNAGPYAIEAGFNENSIYIRFNQDLGYVNIMVNNALDITVYSDIVNTGIQQIVVIPISGIPSGDYTLVLESAFGYSDGGFGKE